ncbi:GGDEF domain-containing protein [Castellaniella sp.]|uniref:GGDEF domain-containing protein n=1 Tax=Castellaniella sp. TaxID=1955812 RepID=UPI002AFF4BE5|nr:GGDEF domain-containing protein [Castellaniella sp.]
MTHQTRQQTADIVARLKLCKRLPTLPTVALRLVELANDESTSLDEFAEQITYDPALAGKLLRVANSSFYGRRSAVTNLPQAMSLLGLNATIALSLSFSLRACLSQQYKSGFDTNAYWRRTLLTALACRTIAEKLGEVQPEDFLLAGLLQDIGILAMDAMFGAPYAELYQQSTDHRHLLVQETVRFGFTHAQAAAHLLKNWGLPDRICQAAWLSHELTQLPHTGPTEDEKLPFYVAAAAVIADAWMKEQIEPDSIELAYDPAQALLNIRLEQYRSIISAMIQKIPEMESLFDTQLADAQMLQDLEYSARETLAVRSLLRATTQHPASVALESRITVLEEQTQRDSLTGLYSRNYLDSMLQHEFERATRSNTPLSVAFIDVDRFKAINDTFGHAVGDQVLAMVAQRLQAQSRQIDTVARYGGEEFVMLLPETDSEQAETVLQRMLENVRDNPFHTQSGAQGTVTFSAGIATHMEDTQFFQNARALLQAADDALYEAKDRGRERITIHRRDERQRPVSDSSRLIR